MEVVLLKTVVQLVDLPIVSPKVPRPKSDICALYWIFVSIAPACDPARILPCLCGELVL